MDASQATRARVLRSRAVGDGDVRGSSGRVLEVGGRVSRAWLRFPRAGFSVPFLPFFFFFFFSLGFIFRLSGLDVSLLQTRSKRVRGERRRTQSEKIKGEREEEGSGLVSSHKGFKISPA